MSTKTFLFFHGFVAILMLLTPNFLLFLTSKDLVLDLTQLFGLSAIAISLVVSIELFLAFAVSFLSLFFRRFLQMFWGFLLSPFGIFLLVESSLQQNKSLYVDFEVVKSVFLNLSNFWPVITAEINLSTWLIIYELILLGVLMGIYGWQSVSNPLNKGQKLASSISIIVLAIVFAGSGCDDLRGSVAELPEHLSVFPFSLLHCSSGEKTALAQAPASSWLRLKELTEKIEKRRQNFFFDAPTLSNNRSLKKTAASSTPNIVIVALESFRNDAVTSYNPKLDTTPFLSQMADEGLVVPNQYVDHPHTSKSLISLLCGMPTYPSYNLKEFESGSLPYKCLPELLRSFNYTSAYFQPSRGNFENRDKLMNKMSFDDFYSLENIEKDKWKRVNYFGLEDKAMLKPITKWVDRQENPFLLTILTLASHHPYSPPSGFLQTHYTKNKLLNGYYNTVRYTDDFLRELFNKFKERGLAQNTIFVFVSDHGVGNDNLLEVSYPLEDNTHVPLIIWGKEVKEKTKDIKGKRQHSDLLPTLVDLLNLEMKSGSFYGTSFFESVENRPIFLNCKFANCRVMYWDDFKFIQFNNNDVQLFDLASDKKANKDISTHAKEGLIDGLNVIVDDWHKHVREFYEKD